MIQTNRPVRWGILGPGAIAALLATDLAKVPDAEIVAVGSRDRERAERFAGTYGGAAHASYEELVADPLVDLVYVASPHSFHLEHATLALAAGKHVLCEKPLTLDRPTSEKLVATARQNDRFLMEAVWTACHPVVRDLARRVRAGEFGRPRHLTASFCFDAGAAPDHRLRDPALGGGALLDLGVYPLTFAHLLLGTALDLRARGVVDDRGVDLDVAITGDYPEGATAELTVAITVDRPITATLVTDRGRIEVAASFHHPPSYAFHADGAEPVAFTGREPVIGRGYGNQVVEVNRCLREGLRESPLVPHDRSLLIMRQLDDLRRQLSA